MDIWNILEIDPTPDTKIIKRAYAKKLKVTRPDENPQGFQELHEAYKRALDEADYWEEETDSDSIEATDDSVGQDQSRQPQPVSLDPIDTHSEIEEHHISSEPEIHQPEVNPYQQEGERLLDLAQLLLTANHNEQNNPDNWAFVMESPFILEDQFNWRLGLEILRLIDQHNAQHMGRTPALVGQDVLTYLNGIFNWIDNRHYVTRALGEDFEKWLDMIHSSETNAKPEWQDKIRGGKKLTVHQPQSTSDEIQIAHPGRRALAWLIDMAIITLIISALHNDNKTLPIPISFCLLSLAYYLFFESSELQGSMGKRIMGLRLVNANFEPISIGRNFLRLATYCAYCTLSVLAITLIATPIPFVAFFAMGYFIFTFAQSITYYDRISKTRVVKY